MGSPVNRINLMANKANQALLQSAAPRAWTEFRPYASAWYHYFVFKLSLSALAVWFYVTKLFGARHLDLDSDETVKRMMYEQLGVVVDENAFDA